MTQEAGAARSKPRGWRRWLLVAALTTMTACTVPGTVPREAAGDDWASVAASVHIRRDTHGVPHIRAADVRGAAFGMGYAQAEDHMQEIGRRILQARGEAARHFGASEVDSDFSMLQFDNLREAALDLEQVSEEFRGVVTGFAAGLDHYVQKHRDALPEWMPRIDAVDVMALIRSRSVAMVAAPRHVEALERKYGKAGRDEEAGVEGPGSNAFAISGARTDSGAPLLLANPHLSWASLYWEAHVTVPGVLDFYGNTLAGYPVLWAGFNDRIGWANTVNAADLDDIYALRIDPDASDHYLFEGRSRALDYREYEVAVADGAGGTEVVRRGFWFSHLGPLIHRREGLAFAMRSERLESPRQFEGFYQLAKTRSLAEFREVFRNTPVFGCNFIYADVDGNILYLWHAPLPRRPDDGTDYSVDVPADDARYVWTELHGADDMPFLLNPPGGIVQNANNPPWWASPDDEIDASKFPSYFERGPLALRPQLALGLLRGDQRFSPESVLAINGSPRLLLAERVLPQLLEVAATSTDADVARARRVLAAWDRQVASDSRGAVLFLRFWDTYAAEREQPFAAPWSASDATGTPHGLADGQVALEHLARAARWVRERHGSEDVAWGEVNRLRMRGLDLPGDGADGKYGTFRVMRYVDAADGKRMIGVPSEGASPVGFGDNWIMMLEFTQPIRAWSVLGSGQSGHWDSPHATDQLALFQANQLRQAFFSEDEIQANIVRSYSPAD